MREIGKSVWNNDGLEFYYIVEKIVECTIPRNYFWHCQCEGKLGTKGQEENGSNQEILGSK